MCFVAIKGERIGVSACRRLQSVINFFETSCVIMAVSKSSLAPPDADTPTRFPPRRTKEQHFSWQPEIFAQNSSDFVVPPLSGKRQAALIPPCNPVVPFRTIITGEVSLTTNQFISPSPN